MAYAKYAELRERKGVTDYRVAKETGISRSFFTDWQRGVYQPKIAKLQKLAAYFGVPVTVFLE